MCPKRRAPFLSSDPKDILLHEKKTYIAPVPAHRKEARMFTIQNLSSKLPTGWKATSKLLITELRYH
jgi:hypothetical protein